MITSLEQLATTMYSDLVDFVCGVLGKAEMAYEKMPTDSNDKYRGYFLNFETMAKATLKQGRNLVQRMEAALDADNYKYKKKLRVPVRANMVVTNDYDTINGDIVYEDYSKMSVEDSFEKIVIDYTKDQKRGVMRMNEFAYLLENEPWGLQSGDPLAQKLYLVITDITYNIQQSYECAGQPLSILYGPDSEQDMYLKMPNKERALGFGFRTDDITAGSEIDP